MPHLTEIVEAKAEQLSWPTACKGLPFASSGRPLPPRISAQQVQTRCVFPATKYHPAIRPRPRLRLADPGPTPRRVQLVDSDPTASNLPSRPSTFPLPFPVCPWPLYSQTQAAVVACAEKGRITSFLCRRTTLFRCIFKCGVVQHAPQCPSRVLPCLSPK